MYVMIESKNDMWKVGFYTPGGDWVDAPPMSEREVVYGESVYERKTASLHVNWLNGGTGEAYNG